MLHRTHRLGVMGTCGAALGDEPTSGAVSALVGAAIALVLCCLLNCERYTLLYPVVPVQWGPTAQPATRCTSLHPAALSNESVQHRVQHASRVCLRVQREYKTRSGGRAGSDFYRWVEPSHTECWLTSYREMAKCCIMAKRKRPSARRRKSDHVADDPVSQAADAVRKDIIRRQQRDRTANAALTAAMARQLGWKAGLTPLPTKFLAAQPQWPFAIMVEVQRGSETAVIGWNVHVDDLDLVSWLPAFEGSLEVRLRAESVLDLAEALVSPRAKMPLASSMALERIRKLTAKQTAEQRAAEYADDLRDRITKSSGADPEAQWDESTVAYPHAPERTASEGATASAPATVAESERQHTDANDVPSDDIDAPTETPPGWDEW